MTHGGNKGMKWNRLRVHHEGTKAIDILHSGVKDGRIKEIFHVSVLKKESFVDPIGVLSPATTSGSF